MWWVQLLNSIVGLLNGSAGGGAGAFESIATATGTGSSRTITFTSIPSTYSALQIRFLGKATDSATQANYTTSILVNSDTGSNYASHSLIGNGTAASATGAASATSIDIVSVPNSFSSYASMFGVGIIDIVDYASTTKNKTLRNNNGFNFNLGTTAERVQLTSGLWASTAAINSITFQLPSGIFWTTTSSIALYGIKGA